MRSDITYTRAAARTADAHISADQLHGPVDPSDTVTATPNRLRSRRSLLRAGSVAGVLLAAGVVAFGSAAAASASTGYIGYGSSNRTGVRCIQRAENLISGPGYPDPHLWEDGVFGSKTLAATKNYQRLYHLRADGIVGPVTGRYIMRELLGHSAIHHNCAGHVPQ